jgi:hypothetical protein
VVIFYICDGFTEKLCSFGKCAAKVVICYQCDGFTGKLCSFGKCAVAVIYAAELEMMQKG